MGNDGFLYYAVYHPHYTGTGTVTWYHCFLLCLSCPCPCPGPVQCVWDLTLLGRTHVPILKPVDFGEHWNIWINGTAVIIKLKFLLKAGVSHKTLLKQIYHGINQFWSWKFKHDFNNDFLTPNGFSIRTQPSNVKRNTQATCHRVT